MKLIKFSILILCLVFISACSNDEHPKPENNIINDENQSNDLKSVTQTNITIPQAYKTPTNFTGETHEDSFQITYVPKSGGVSKTATFTFIADDDGGISSLSVNNEFANDFQASHSIPLENLFLDPAITNLKNKDLSSCLNQCQRDYTNPDGSKKKGRGRCKWRCWKNAMFQAMITVATAYTISIVTD